MVNPYWRRSVSWTRRETVLASPEEMLSLPVLWLKPPCSKGRPSWNDNVKRCMLGCNALQTGDTHSSCAERRWVGRLHGAWWMRTEREADRAAGNCEEWHHQPWTNLDPGCCMTMLWTFLSCCCCCWELISFLCMKVSKSRTGFVPAPTCCTIFASPCGLISEDGSYRLLACLSSEWYQLDCCSRLRPLDHIESPDPQASLGSLRSTTLRPGSPGWFLCHPICWVCCILCWLPLIGWSFCGLALFCWLPLFCQAFCCFGWFCPDFCWGPGGWLGFDFHCVAAGCFLVCWGSGPRRCARRLWGLPPMDSGRFLFRSLITCIRRNRGGQPSDEPLTKISLCWTHL